MGRSVGTIVTGTPNGEKGLFVIFTLPPLSLNENVTGGGASGPGDDAGESLKPNGRLVLDSAGGGVLGAAPNENGVLAFWSLLLVLAFPNENLFSEKRGLTVVEVSVVPPNKEFGGSLDVVLDESSPKLNSEGVTCLGASGSESAPVGGTCDVDAVRLSDGGIALGIPPPKSVDEAVWGSLGNENAVGGVLNNERSATVTSLAVFAQASETVSLDP